MSIEKKKLIMLQGNFDKAAFEQLRSKKVPKVYVLEGRPKLDAAQRTSNTVNQLGIKPVLISDNMAGFLFAQKLVQEVWLSYQLVDDKGAVCRIGGLILAVLGKKHNVPVYLFRSGKKIKFMGRSSDLVHFKGVRVAPKGIRAYVPQVEWVPGKYITKRYE